MVESPRSVWNTESSAMVTGSAGGALKSGLREGAQRSGAGDGRQGRAAGQTVTWNGDCRPVRPLPDDQGARRVAGRGPEPRRCGMGLFDRNDYGRDYRGGGRSLGDRMRGAWNRFEERMGGGHPGYDRDV